MIWFEYISFFAAAFIMSFIISGRLPDILERYSVYDRKSLPRKVLTSGGAAIAVSFITVVVIATVFNSPVFNLAPQMMLSLCVASALVASMGFWDDTKGLSAVAKLAIQAVAALILIGSGLQMGEITNPFAGSVSTGLLGNFILVVWILAITNAVNLIDGIDGLAGGISLISAFTLFIISHIFGEHTLSLLSLVLAGGIVGFIRFNLPPAKIYLGDTGSLFLGFALAAISLTERRKGSVTITLLVPLLVLAVPLIDTIMAFFRRMLSGKNPLKGDTMHIHHRLLKLGLSAKQINLMLYMFTVYLSLVAGVMAFFPKETTMVVVILLAVGILMGLEFLNSLERDKTSE